MKLIIIVWVLVCPNNFCSVTRANMSYDDTPYTSVDECKNTAHKLLGKQVGSGIIVAVGCGIRD